MTSIRDEIIEEYNHRFFITKRGAQLFIGMDRNERGELLDEVEWYTKEAFFDFMAPDVLQVPTENPKTGAQSVVKIPKAKVWWESPERRTYLRVGMDPGPNPDPDTYNLWRGFAYEPKPGDWSLFFEHLKDNICRGNEAYLDYLLGWMAYAVQNPHLPGEVAVVLRGAKGTGKGTFANVFGNLFGKHFLPIANRKHLTGNFNAHLQECVLLFVDEGFWAGDREHEGVLKMLITDPWIPIEAKFVDLKKVPNMLHIIMASNESWVVPARGMERRFFVLDIDPAHAGDHKYFAAMRKQLNEGGYSGMLHDLLAMDLTEFNVRMPPKTEALLEQMEHSMSDFENWWFDKLMEGNILRTRPGWGDVPAATLYADYEMQADKRKHTISRQQFTAELKRMLPPGFDVVRARLKTGKRDRIYTIPDLAACRKFWDTSRGIEFNWNTKEQSDDD